MQSYLAYSKVLPPPLNKTQKCVRMYVPTLKNHEIKKVVCKTVAMYGASTFASRACVRESMRPVQWPVPHDAPKRMHVAIKKILKKPNLFAKKKENSVTL